jgi:ABC-type lipoprotein release transport system permease subunit
MHRARTRPLLVLALLAASVPLSSQSQGTAAPPSILISRQLAESRTLRIGDVVQLSADPSGSQARSFRIAGVYEPTPDPMRFAQQRLEARLHLPDLLALTADPSDPSAADSITSINVALEQPSDGGAFSRDVTARLPAVTARPTTAPDERTTTFIVVERFHLAIAIVTVLGSAVFLLALMVMLVDERRGTVGTLRLLGFTRQRILIQVLAEGALIAVTGAAAGILFAFAMQGVFNRFFQWRYDTTLIFLRITPAVVWRSLLMAVPLGIAASLVASWTLLRQQILALVRR